MLNLFVMHFLLIISLFINLLIGWVSPKSQLDLVRILSPQKDQVLLGNIDIVGTATGIGFQYAEVSFRFQNSENDTWFLISQIGEPKIDEFLTNWDTSTIIDGDYQIKIQAFFEDGHSIESMIGNLRIRNYSTIETATPTILQSQKAESTKPSSVITEPTQNNIHYATSLPQNELTVGLTDISAYAIRGALIGILLLITLGIWILIRHRQIG